MTHTVNLTRHIRVAFEEELGLWVGRYSFHEMGHTHVEFGSSAQEAWESVAETLMSRKPLCVSDQIVWWETVVQSAQADAEAQPGTTKP